MTWSIEVGPVHPFTVLVLGNPVWYANFDQSAIHMASACGGVWGGGGGGTHGGVWVPVVVCVVSVVVRLWWCVVSMVVCGVSVVVCGLSVVVCGLSVVVCVEWRY